jgi:glycine/D-amino acid oxidase-like deaminating enzyme
MRAATASADIAIIGGGIIGLATAERLVAHGASVIVVDEQGATGGATAASGGLVRAFDPTGTHTAWTAEGFAVYQRGGLRGAWPALHADGSLTLIGKQDLPHARSAAAALRTAGHEADILSADEITGKFPDLTIPGHLAGVFEPYAGWLPAAQVAQAILHDAGHALNLRTARATRLLHDSSGIRGVETTTGTVHTRAALLAAGVGSEALAASAGVHLPLRTRSVSYCLFRPEPAGGIGDLPTLVDRTTGAWLRRWGTDGTVLAGVASPRTDVPPTVTASARPSASATQHWRTRAQSAASPHTTPCSSTARAR